MIGCASIPKSTYQVSETIGETIRSNEVAHLELVDKYFGEKREKIDLWIVRVYFPHLIDNIKMELKRENMSEQLTENQYEDVVAVVIGTRDEMQSNLEQIRISVVEKVRTNYSELIRVNSDLTQLLKSSSELKEVLEKNINKSVGIEFDFDEFDKSFNNQLKTVDKLVN